MNAFTTNIIFRPCLNMEGKSSTQRMHFFTPFANSWFGCYDFEKFEIFYDQIIAKLP